MGLLLGGTPAGSVSLGKNPMINGDGDDGARRGTTGLPVPLGCLHNYTGGEWSRLRSCGQGKRAEEGNDDLVNHPLHTNKCRS